MNIWGRLALPGNNGSVLVATGFAKWGMTNATAAALAIAGRVTGEVPQWSAGLYSHTEDSPTSSTRPS